MARYGDLFSSFCRSDEPGESVVGIAHAEIYAQILARILVEILAKIGKKDRKPTQKPASRDEKRAFALVRVAS
jgi:hypothetical protein